jgi:probable addiction module antidote protein
MKAKRALKAGSPYHEWEVKLLRSDPELAVEYLKAALESLDSPDERGGSLLMLRALAEAYGGMAKVAGEAGISRESLYRSLSPKGNPTFKTLTAIVNAMGLRLSVVEARKPAKTRAKAKAKAGRKAA